MSRCNHCGGALQMLGYNDGLSELRCLLCGRSNEPPPSIARIDADLGPRGGEPDRRFRLRKKEWNRPRAAVALDYQRCLEHLEHVHAPFYARDLAGMLGVSVTIASHLLKRAEKDGRVRVQGMPTIVRLHGAGTTKPLIWETLPTIRAAAG